MSIREGSAARQHSPILKTMHISLKDKVVLVTGGSRGIGKAIVEQLAAADATIAVHYRASQASAEHLAERAGNDSRAFQANLVKAPEVQELASAVLAAYGRLDVLVNNAGLSFFESPDQRESEWLSLWQTTLQVNLVAAAHLCRAFIPHFIRQGDGRIVNIASRAAFRGDVPAYMAYAASKGGMVAMSRTIARGYGKQGIKSFVVAPGFTHTDMAQKFIDQYGEELVMKDIALNKLTEPKDVAPTVLFLASGLMDHATGCTIDINAGSYVR